MNEEIKVLLGDNASNFSDAQISLSAKQAALQVSSYTGRKVEGDTELEMIAERIAVINLNRLNTEGLTGYSAGGVSENYNDGWPADIVLVLNRRRKVKVI